MSACETFQGNHVPRLSAFTHLCYKVEWFETRTSFFGIASFWTTAAACPAAFSAG